MRANEKEITCIIYVEKFFKKKGFKNLYQRFFKAYKVEKTKTLFSLWRLHGCEGYNLEEAKRIDCINNWIKILYDLDYNIESDINSEIDSIKAHQKRLKDEAEKNNLLMVRVNYADPFESALRGFSKEFGDYQS